jgi:hypothetical protein
VPDAAEAAVTAIRTSLAALGNRLVDLESDATVELARSGCLTGASASAWAEADAGLSAAWETYRAVDDLVRQAEADPSRWVTLELATVPRPGPGGPTNPTEALAAAARAVDDAAGVAGRLLAAWDSLAARTTAASQLATNAGATDVERSANALAELLASDPLAVTESDVADLEQRAAAADARRTAVKVASARIDVDLDQARHRLAELESDLGAAGAELDHAASRIAGLGRPDPVPDLDALARWLDQIAAQVEGGAEPTRAASTLDDWLAAAQARRADLDAALGRARDALRRREDGRGLWKALRAKAGAVRLDERTEVADALTAAQEALWRAPCDLDAAEAALARVSAVLKKGPAKGSANGSTDGTTDDRGGAS